MIYSEEAIVDKVIYNRVPTIRESINVGLIKRLYDKVGEINEGDEIEWTFTDIPSTCCKQLKVKVSIEINED